MERMTKEQFDLIMDANKAVVARLDTMNSSVAKVKEMSIRHDERIKIQGENQEKIEDKQEAIASQSKDNAIWIKVVGGVGAVTIATLLFFKDELGF